MMKLGIIDDFPPTEESLAFIQSCDVSFIELCCNFDKDSVRCTKEIDNVYAKVKNAGLFIGSLGRWNAVMNIGGKINEDEYALVAQNLDDAIKVHSNTFVCGCNYDDSISLYKNYTVAIEIFGRLVEKAKGSGTKVAVYNCDWNNFVTNMETWKVVLGELPDLMIKFDPSHSYNAGRDYMREIVDWGNRFAHVHIKGAVITNGAKHVDDPPAGMDDLKWGSIMAALYSCGYDGCLSIEPHSDQWQFNTERGKAGVRFTVDYIKKFIM